MPCEKPITIPNPNKGKDPTRGMNFLKDCESEFIKVPCGHCDSCIALEQMELVQRIQMESMQNYIFMGTVTYRNLVIPKLTVGEFQYRYADVNDLNLCIKRIRNNNAYGIPFRYIYVTERGSKRARPHAHILMLFKKEDIGYNYYDVIDFEQKHKWVLLNYWQRNYGSNRNPIYIDLCKYVECWTPSGLRKTYDWHYVNPLSTNGGISDAAFYVLKYMLKGDEIKASRDGKEYNPINHEQAIKSALFTNYDEQKARQTWNTIKSKKRISLGFGLGVEFENKDRSVSLKNADFKIIDYLKGGVNQCKHMKTEYPYFFHPERLETFPLAKYYKKFDFIYDDEDAYEFWKNSKRNPGEMITEERTGDQLVKKMNNYYQKLKIQEMECVADDFDKLLNE